MEKGYRTSFLYGSEGVSKEQPLQKSLKVKAIDTYTMFHTNTVGKVTGTSGSSEAEA